jgi:ParB family transcriptional regulator, chromosome partitioning protein
MSIKEMSIKEMSIKEMSIKEINIKEINIDKLIISPLNVRTILEENDIKIQNLADNIKQHGLLNPLTVVLNNQINKYEIIAGQRRYLAIKKLKYSSISCNIVDINEKECIFISLIENLQRDTMSLSDKVKTYKSLHTSFNCNLDELSKNINISPTTINKYLKISHLSDTILNKLDTPKNSTEGISLDFATNLVKLDINDDEELLKIIEIFDDTNKTEKTKILKHIQNQTKEDNHCEDFDKYIEKIKTIKKQYLTDKEKKLFEEEKNKKKQEQSLKEQAIKEKALKEHELELKVQAISLNEKTLELKEKEDIYKLNNYLVRNSNLQKEYRQNIIKRYKKCIISGMFEDVCEAAHIKPFCEADKESCFNINNGILLNRVLHKLFDSYDISINPDTLNIEIKKCKNYEFIKMYENKHIEILNKYPETIIFLKEHYTEFKK